eukprot:CAMPEP_0194437570 /NCGR_PEP_ID=MMETSP0176-20130528/100650_1 /TAXON_ID=216777 /ORGANISM="Proboscia alata, Strain PI-D3" /LENGTH=126 /DNA_ID=CAMNT_0039258945 /DNA_START=46 /DNA_END=423 /DNA_ORIENTATION=+
MSNCDLNVDDIGAQAAENSKEFRWDRVAELRVNNIVQEMHEYGDLVHRASDHDITQMISEITDLIEGAGSKGPADYDGYALYQTMSMDGGDGNSETYVRFLDDCYKCCKTKAAMTVRRFGKLECIA